MTRLPNKQNQRRHCDNSSLLQSLRSAVYNQRAEGWYFNTREGIEFGPYNNFEEVEQARAHFVSSLSNNQAYRDDGYSPSLVFLETIEL